MAQWVWSPHCPSRVSRFDTPRSRPFIRIEQQLVLNFSTSGRTTVLAKIQKNKTESAQHQKKIWCWVLYQPMLA
ncbi:MAG: hypothetical protein EZS28_031679 [Streblomastix strix]|uniref:Uncharacterized protein n=1 Tax=Streblomastix strix TaxID=222440 RepID=A0A5J4UR37_9EUKA|nr:MAG: hypothetical protein EZS28_031679 [Streblomastix strix]